MAKRAKDTLDFLSVLAEQTASPLAPATPYRLLELPLTSINPSPYQARKHFDPGEIAELADTLRIHGVLQPIIVRPLHSGYELIAGERRWRAAQLAGIASIPVIVREVNDEEAATLSLVENLQRSALNPMEEAEGYQTLIERGLSQQAIGAAVGKSVSAISRTLGLLGLADPVKEALRAGELDYAHGRVLLSLPKGEQVRLAQLAVRRAWSSRQLEQAARTLKDRLDETARRGRPLTREDPDTAALRERLSQHLGAPVEFRTRPTGAGQIVIHYHSVEECNGILERLNLLNLED